MVEGLGWLGLIFALLAIGVAGNLHRSVAPILGVAFAVRTAAALFHYYVAPLPDGRFDAVAFEKHAWAWSQGGVGAALDHFPGLDSYFYAWLMSLLYAVIGRSLPLLQSFSVLVGVLGVYATWRLAREIWDARTARKAAWVMALFPVVSQYGALTMREAWVVLFFVLGLIGVALWARRGGMMPVLGGIVAFVAAMFFHGGMFVAVLGFLGLIAIRSSRRLLFGLSRGRLQVLALVGLVTVVSLAGLYMGSDISIQKLGTAEEFFSVEFLSFYFESRVHGGAQYPEWTQPSTPPDLVWAVPLRGLYLLFSPFPWDLREPGHVVGLVDGLLYLGLAFLVWRQRHAILAKPDARAVLFIVVALVLAYGIGTGNFGTALRHRAKLVAGLIVLASPRLPQLVWSSGAGARGQPRLRRVSGLGPSSPYLT